MIQALVTGATGMLGRHLVDVLVEAGVSVRAYVRSSNDSSYLHGHIHDLARYRGRPYYAPHVQAADYFLRQSLQYYSLSGLHLRAVQPLEENSWMVQFNLAASGETHQLWIQRQMTSQKRLVSCSSPAEKVVPRYRLIEHMIV